MCGTAIAITFGGGDEQRRQDNNAMGDGDCGPIATGNSGSCTMDGGMVLQS